MKIPQAVLLLLSVFFSLVQAQAQTLDATRKEAEQAIEAGIAARKQKEYTAAIDSFSKAEERYKSIGYERDTSFSNLIIEACKVYEEVEQYGFAIQYYPNALSIIEEKIGKKSLEYVTVLGKLGVAYHKTKAYGDAASVFKQTSDLYRLLPDQEGTKRALYLFYTGICFSYLNDYQSALTCNLNALQMMEAMQEKRHPEYQNCLHNTAIAYEQLGKIDSALFYFMKKSPQESKTAIGEQRANIYVEKAKQRQETAIANYHKAIDIFDAAGAKTSENYIAAVLSIKDYYSDKGDYKSAVPYFNRIAAYVKGRKGDTSAEYEYAMLLIAQLYSLWGYSETTLNYCKAAALIAKQRVGEQSEDYGAALNNIAVAYEKANDLKNALSYYRQASTIYEKFIDYKNNEFTLSMYLFIQCNIGSIYKRMGDLEKAKEIYASVEATCDTTSQLAVLHKLNELKSGLCCYTEKYEEALSYAKNALRISKTIHTEEEVAYGETLQQVGTIYRLCNDYDSALKYYTDAEKIFARKIGRKSTTYVNILSDLGNAALLLKNYTQAEQYFTEAYRLQIDSIGEVNYNATNNILGHFYDLYYAQHKSERMYEYAEQILSTIRTDMKQAFAYMTEKQRADYWTMHNHKINAIYAAARLNDIDPQRYGALLYDAALVGKGLLLNTSQQIDRIISSANQPQLSRLLTDLKALRNRIDGSQNSSDLPQIKSLIHQADSLERDLLEGVAKLEDYTKELALDWREVKNRLGNDDIAIEFIDFNHNRAQHYAAVVLKKEWATPQIVYLFADSTNTLSEIISTAKTEVYNDTDFSAKIWSKITPLLKEVKNIYFSPTGGLYQIGIEYLPIDKTTRMFDRYNMYRLSSTRELLREKESVSPPRNAVLYGGLNYNNSPEDMMLYADLIEPDEQTATRFPQSREMRGLIWSYLKGTEKEVSTIAPILTQKQYRTAVYTGNEGVEESFKALSGKRTEIIHIATHGFFLPQNGNQPAPESLGTASKEDIPADNSLLRAGLIFAGANNAWLDRTTLPENIEDGIATAQEVSRLDFRGTELIVMSACQTGLGEISLEGVFGLQRAFKKAGAKTLLMSLWSVDDQATQVMMTAFYRGLMNGLSKRDAFLGAQQQLRAQTFEINGAPRSGDDPYFWAAFIMLD